METKINVDNPGQLTLTDDAQEKIVKFIAVQRDKAKQAAAPYLKNAEECERIYKCEPKPLEGDDVDWQSNHVLPWGYDAVESAYAHLASTMVPKDEQVFEATGRTQEDHPGVKVMAQYLEHRLDESGFVEQFKKGLHQLLRKNHTCLKRYWRKDIRTSHEIQVDPMDGKKKRIPTEKVVFNNVWFDVVDINDFWFFPIHGDFNKTTRGHVGYRHLEELKAEKEQGVPYFNLELINEKKESDDLEQKKKTYQGLKVEEVWIHRLKIDDQVYNNVMATVVNEKTIIRFQPNGYPMGESPFVWACANPDGDCLYGYGLLSRGIQLVDYASFLLNQRGNEIKVNLYGSNKYYDDGVFNPYNVISRPGALIRMASAESCAANLVPVAQGNTPMLMEATQEILMLKGEFESVTVPKVVKGMIETTRQTTATEQTLAQNNSSGKLHILAGHLNNCLLKPVLDGMYSMIYQQKDIDPSVLEDIARLTQESTTTMDTDPTGNPLPKPIVLQRSIQEMVQDLPEILPLPEIDIKLVGYQNMIRKQEKLQNISMAIPQFMQSPWAKYIKGHNLMETTFRLLDLDYDSLLCDSEEAKKIDAQEQQAQQKQQDLLIMQEKAKLDIQAMKEQTAAMKAEHDNRMMELDRELKYMELQLKFQAEENRAAVEAETLRDLKINQEKEKLQNEE